MRIGTTLVLSAVVIASCTVPEAPERPTVRIATFNASLHRGRAGELAADLASRDEQARAIAAIVQRARPDVLLLNEFDHDPSGDAVRRFVRDYLGRSQHGSAPIDYPYVFVAPINTGEPTGFDLDGDGNVGGPGDAFGYGAFPGQYGMLLLSRHPILAGRARTFRMFPWRDVPDGALPMDFYGPEASAALRLSSKSHWDVPVQLPDGRVIHLLASHPTPPVFDGPEDRNGRRNHDELRFWADYVVPENSQWIVDDAGARGGLGPDEAFVILGDLNADPWDGDAAPGAIEQLVTHSLVATEAAPASEGGRVASERLGGVNAEHTGDPRFDTAQFAPDGAGNLRLDYVLPSWHLEVVAGAVFWPTPDDPDHELIDASDHRLVFVDVR